MERTIEVLKALMALMNEASFPNVGRVGAAKITAVYAAADAEIKRLERPTLNIQEEECDPEDLPGRGASGK